MFRLQIKPLIFVDKQISFDDLVRWINIMLSSTAYSIFANTGQIVYNNR